MVDRFRRSFLNALTGLIAMSVFPGSGIARQEKEFSGFYVPDEAEPHLRTFMQWPVSLKVYGDRTYLLRVQMAIADTANAIAEFEPVVMLMDKAHATSARRLLSSKVEIWNVPTEDLWCRDSGPLFMRNEAGDLAVSHLNFNGWGDKQVHGNDGKVARRIAEILELPLFDNALVGEPGGVESNGYGTLLAHESSWVNKNRNKQAKSVVTEKLLEAYGAEKIIWAPGIAGEDITDYHIDALARFVAEDTVLVQLPEKIVPGDPWSKAAFETHDIIKKATTHSGNPIKTVIIPDPKRPRVKSLDFVASYANYYVCNGAVVIAEFGDVEADTIARETLMRLYPSRDIVALNVDPLGSLGGGIHCATQQQPSV